MDPRTIGQILSNPDWLRQTYGEERTIQPTPPPAPAYQQLAPTQTQAVPVRPESDMVEVRGTIAYVAHYRAEYFNPNDQPTMMLLAQNVIMNQTGAESGEAPPPWFPDVQFWIQSFERIDPYATAQQAELERLHAAKLEQEALIRIREAERAEQLRREQLLYGEPGTFSREGTFTGGLVGADHHGRPVEPTRENGWNPGPIPGSAGPDWLGDILREITGSIGAIHQRLEAMERRDGGAGGADPALHPDQRHDDDADHRRREPEARRADRPDPGDGGAAAAYPVDAADIAPDGPDHDDGNLPAEPGRADEPTRPRSYADRHRRRSAEKDA